MMTPTSKYHQHRSRELDRQPPLAEHKLDDTALPPAHLQIPTPSPSVSHWSRSSYSVSISGERGFSDGGSAAARGSADAALTPASLGPLHNRDDDGRKETRIFGLPCDICMAFTFLVLIVIAVAVLLGVSFSNGDGGPTHKSETSTSTHKQSTESTTSITSDLTDSTSGTAVVTLVATQIIRTTVGTLTVHGSYAGTISSTITETSVPFIGTTVQ
jgi:hypothetical protein